MTRNEALYKVKGYLTDIIPEENYSEVEEIIKALEQEPCKSCEDCISRQLAIKIISIPCGTCLARNSKDCKKCSVPKLSKLINVMPSVDRSTGKWIKTKYGYTWKENNVCLNFVDYYDAKEEDE